MKTAIATNIMYRKGAPRWVEITQSQKFRYNGLDMGVDYVWGNDDPHPDLSPCWSKPQFLMSLMDRYDWLVWMDADAMPINFAFDLNAYLETVGERVVMQKDKNGWNNGVFALPCTEKGCEWIRHIEDQCHDPKYRKGMKEQQCMADSFENGWGDFVVEPPPEIGWNSYPKGYNWEGNLNTYKDGDWVIHLPGMKDEALRERILKEFVL